MAEVEAAVFRTADAHYLDECFLMRDAVLSLEISTADPGKRAPLLFSWTMRNVIAHEQVDNGIPPAVTARRGFGSPLERALVFLALLRQARIEGCLIVVPNSEPLLFVVAVLEKEGEKSPGKLSLYDTRLGSPLKSKDQKSVLTLNEALADPALLKPAQITPEQTKALQAWLVCPLYALSPRMLELQKNLGTRDAIVLHLDAPLLRQEIAGATTIPVKVWNPPAEGKALPNSPTRCLSLYIPKLEGGLDETGRADFVARKRIPKANVLANWAPLNLTQDLLPVRVYGGLLDLIEDLCTKYDLQSREMFLRGRYEAMIRREERLQVFAHDDGLVGLTRNADFRKELADWRAKIDSARQRRRQ